MIDRFARKWYLTLYEYELNNFNQKGIPPQSTRMPFL